MFGYGKDRVKQAGLWLWDLLESDGGLCSPKSQLEPSMAIDWIGEKMDGTCWSMQSLAGYLAGMVTLWIKLATLGYCQKTLQRLLGKLAWADCPSREMSPLTNGPLAWLMWGPQNAHTAQGFESAGIGNSHDDRTVDG